MIALEPMASKRHTKSRKPTARHGNHGQVWTARELSLIERHYGRMPRKEFIERYLPGRTLKAVEFRAALLGVTCRSSKRPEYWAPEEIELLRRHYGKILNKELRARYLPNRSDMQLRAKAGELGLRRTVSQRWTLERVVAEIRALDAVGQLGSSTELKRQGREDLVGAAIYHAGTWGKARQLAGLDYVARRSWTKAAILREIRRLHRAGRSVLVTQVDTGLSLAARRRFGSWRKARAAALPSYAAGHQQWTRKKLTKALANLHARGVSLSSSEVRAMGEGRLINAAVRLFGSWDAARRHAIDDFTPLLQTWTKERVIAELQRHAPDGVRPTCTRVGQALYKVSIARFGSFDEVCRAAGLHV
jgi:hypothetical protein